MFTMVVLLNEKKIPFPVQGRELLKRHGVAEECALFLNAYSSPFNHCVGRASDCVYSSKNIITQRPSLSSLLLIIVLLVRVFVDNKVSKVPHFLLLLLLLCDWLKNGLRSHDDIVLCEFLRSRNRESGRKYLTDHS